MQSCFIVSKTPRPHTSKCTHEEQKEMSYTRTQSHTHTETQTLTCRSIIKGPHLF